MSRALLDVNVLLALLDSDHVNHRQAQVWLMREGANGWASCAITQNGFVRIVTGPQYPNPTTVGDAVARLRGATQTAFHRYWPCDLSLLDGMVDPSRLHGTNQITDAYLLALAVHHGGRFVTFDRRVALSVVPSATPGNLLVIGDNP